MIGLELAMLCKELHVLPGPGGVFDQDILHMRWLRAGLAAMHEAERIEANKNKSARH